MISDQRHQTDAPRERLIRRSRFAQASRRGATLVPIAGLAFWGLCLTGCGSFPFSKAQPQSRGAVTTAQPALDAPTIAGALPGEGLETGVVASEAAPANVQRREPIDALITHIAGEPLYASQVLMENEGALRSMASQTTPDEFRERAYRSLEGSVTQVVLSILAVAEAEATMTEREQEHLDAYMNYRKQELIRQYGQGSYNVADARVQEVFGMPLNEFMRVNVRERRLVDVYLDKTLDPLVNVTRRDIERYYKDNPELFNPEPKFVVRRIRVATQEEADAVQTALEAGEPFVDLAGADNNQTSRQDGGLWSGGEPISKNIFRFQPLNDAYAALDEGQWAGPLEEAMTNGQPRYWFVYVEDRIGGVSRSLVEAQGQIHNTLVEEQKRLYQARINQRLFRRAGITPTSIRGYTAQIVEVAAARFGPRPDSLVQ